MQPVNQDSRDPAAWIGYARADLILAETPPRPASSDPPVLRAQQAAEKAIKAVILDRTGEPAAFSHNSRRLIRDAEQAGAPAPPLSAEAAQALTFYAVLTRYPADLDEVDEVEWHQAVADARAVVEWAAEHLGGRA